MNFKESKPFKYFNIKIPYPVLFKKKFSEYLFSKGVLIRYEKTTPWNIYFLENYDWRVAYIYGDTGTIFKKKEISCKKKKLHVNSTSNTFNRKYENFDYTLTVSICPKIT